MLPCRHWIMRVMFRNMHLRPKSQMSSVDARLSRPSFEVTEALREGRSVVALESAIITHGMPYPENLTTARNVERIVRRNGAVPATVAMLNGIIHIGLTEEQMETLARSKRTTKLSRRDLPIALAKEDIFSKKYDGGTTVSATALIAHKVGIDVFVTGGIGGVHHGADTTMDVSADLTELSRTPIAVVSAGVKSILDIGKTLEYLETQGVCVITYGNSCDFPAFFTAKSGFQAPYNVETTSDAANVIANWKEFGGKSAILFAVPIPETQAADGAMIHEATMEAIRHARKLEITGKDVTPFVLRRVNELTLGKSLKTNIGSRIAVRLSANNDRHGTTGREGGGHFQMPSSPPAKRPVVIGGSNADIMVKTIQAQVQPNGSTNLGKIWLSFGGVGRNVADVLSRLDHDPVFLTAIGRDTFGDNVLAAAPKLSSEGTLRVDDAPTATYVAVLGKPGEVYLGVGDMDIHGRITKQHVAAHRDHVTSAPLLVMDGNTPQETMEYVLDVCGQHSVPVWFEPTDVHRANKPFLSDGWHNITFISPNMNELRHIYSFLTGDKDVILRQGCLAPLDDLLQECLTLCVPIVQHVPCVVITLDSKGLLIIRNTDDVQPFLPEIRKREEHVVSAIHYEAPKVKIRNVSGAGDCLAGAMIAGIIRRLSAEDCVLSGLKAASLSLQSQANVPDSLTSDNVFGVDKATLLAQFKRKIIL